MDSQQGDGVGHQYQTDHRYSGLHNPSSTTVWSIPYARGVQDYDGQPFRFLPSPSLTTPQLYNAASRQEGRGHVLPYTPATAPSVDVSGFSKIKYPVRNTDQPAQDIPTWRLPQPAAPHRPRFSAVEWENNRESIRGLYIDEEKSLEETMKCMAETFDFRPSKKLYRAKIKEWGWSKYLPSLKADWMLKKAERRKREDGKDTNFLIGDKPLTLDRIQNSAKRAKQLAESVHNDMATPLDITYSTPDNVDASPQVAASPSLEVGHPTPRPQSPPWTPAPNTSTPRLQLAQVTWNGHTMTDLEKMIEEADHLAYLGRPDDAEEKFRCALAGLKALLSPTHEKTNALAYRLAEFYAQNDRMRDADAVLDWMGKRHVERWGIEHERTISHLMFVADMFHRWARPEHAMTLIDRAMEVYQRAVGREQASELLGVSKIFDTHRNQVSITAFDRSTAGSLEDIVPKSAEEQQARYQLGLARAHVKEENEVAESMLKELITQCDNHPEALLVQAFEARCALVDYYSKVGKKDELGAVLAEACTLFWATFDLPRERPLSLFQSTCNIAFAHVEVGLDESAEELLSEIVSIAEETFGPDDGYTVSILIGIGTFYQRKRRWNDARPYYEHALALSMTATGPNSAQSRKLEAALENEHYVGILPGYDDIESALRQRLTLLFGRQP